jgi:hypothetical protein
MELYLHTGASTKHHHARAILLNTSPQQQQHRDNRVLQEAAAAAAAATTTAVAAAGAPKINTHRGSIRTRLFLSFRTTSPESSSSTVKVSSEWILVTVAASHGEVDDVRTCDSGSDSIGRSVAPAPHRTEAHPEHQL